MRRFAIGLLVLLSVAAALLAPSYLGYRRRASIIPPWVRLAGVQVDGATPVEVADALNRVLMDPIAVYYGDERIVLRPQTVAFQVHVEAMLAEAQRYDTAGYLLRYLVGRGIGRPIPPVDVPLRYTLDGDALNAWLTDVAARYDRAPQPPQPMVSALSIGPGKPGQELDAAASRDRVIAALADMQKRSATLVLRETPPPPVDMKALEALLRARAEQFPGIASVFVHHLPTGEEAAVNPDVAYAGMSTMKIIILSELYRVLDQPPGIETTKLITETMSQSGNFTANLLLRIIGDGDSDAGVRILNGSVRRLGLKNTFMATPYDRKYATPPRVVTEANSRTDLNTNPDPYIQTTPRDIGLALEMLVACSQGGGTLLAAYGDAYTPAECQQAVDFIALNEVDALIPEGVPEGTKVVHKHGYAADTHGDVAAIWGPAGPYVLSIFLYRPPWLEWDLSRATMRDLSRAAWNYFSLVSAREEPPGEAGGASRLPPGG